MEKIRIDASGPVESSVRVPGSKSLTNRALIVAALSGGTSLLKGVLDSEDTQMMFTALKTLGLEVRHDPETRQMRIIGHGGRFPVGKANIYIGNSGTTARFLPAALALAPGEKQYRIHGKERMHRRPIRDLLDALKQLGADVKSENRDGCPPVLIGVSEHAQEDWNTPGSAGRPIVASVSGKISSQFLSALMLAAPLISAKNDIVFRITDSLVSKPYIEMTGKVMEAFGVGPECLPEPEHFRDFGTFERREDEKHAAEKHVTGCIVVPAGSLYRPGEYRIEPDASAASYFFAAAAICGGTITIENLSRDSLQGDIRFVELLQQMGCTVEYASDHIAVTGNPGVPLRGITAEMNAISDTVQTLAVVALFAQGPTRIVNVAHIRHKETDRIRAVATELRKIGAEVDEFEDGMEIHPPQNRFHAEIATYDDHRMAMSFSLVGLRRPGVTILDPRCVEKTYPGYFEDFQRFLHARIERF